MPGVLAVRSDLTSGYTLNSGPSWSLRRRERCPAGRRFGLDSASGLL